MRTLIDLTGQTIGTWKVLDLVFKSESSDKRKRRYWKCQCIKCNHKHVIRHDLIDAYSDNSCKNCWKKGDCRRGKRNPAFHEHKAWSKMVKRSPDDVCESWKGENGFTQFLANMGRKPKPRRCYSLQRRDKSQGYSPENCFWKKDRPSYAKHEYEGEKYTIGELAFITGKSPSTLRSRIKSGMTVAEAVNTTSTRGKIYTAFGEKKTWEQWMRDPRRPAAAPETIRQRIVVEKWSFQKAFTHDYAFLPEKYEAFGESKTLAEWLQDPRCGTGNTYHSLRKRLKKCNTSQDNEKAISVDLRTFEEYEAFGEKKTIREWANDGRCRVNVKLLRHRLYSNWEPERAITHPEQQMPLYRAFGEEKTMSEWLKDKRRVVSSRVTITARLKRNWSFEKAITTPVDKKSISKSLYTRPESGIIGISR